MPASPTTAGSSASSRLESFRVDHDSIRVLKRSTDLSDESKVRLWQPHIEPSLATLEDLHRTSGRSLGLIRPDPSSLTFSWRYRSDGEERTQSIQDWEVQATYLNY